MTASAVPSRSSGVPLRTTGVLLAAAVLVGLAGIVVADAAHLAGANAAFAPLMPAVLLPFAVAGLVAGLVGWSVVRRVATRPARVLRVLVPVLTVLSFAPDVLVAPHIPGADATGIVALALMHLVVVAVGVPVYRRIAPLPAADAA